MPPRVWLATPDEAERVAGLLADFRTWYGKDWPSDNAFLAAVERLVEQPAATEFLLGAPHDDAPPAAVAQLRYRFSVWTASDDCWLEDLFVAEAARGSGLGRAMVEAAVERARTRGCRRIELDVDDANTPARALYESLGFAEKNGGNALMQRRL
ncbi:MAG TPA: GNAT family N-acetyltransferase [Solirubrobacteraceae bacterium]|nr:GNAT family N-acetyltransferase [Solirubrobacteraceae bacterium]